MTYAYLKGGDASPWHAGSGDCQASLLVRTSERPSFAQPPKITANSGAAQKTCGNSGQYRKNRFILSYQLLGCGFIPVTCVKLRGKSVNPSGTVHSDLLANYDPGGF